MNRIYPFRSFGKLNISQRTFASLLLFSLPMGVLFYFNLDQIGGNIRFAQKEMQGNRYQQPLIGMLKAVSDYQATQLKAGQPQTAQPQTAQPQTAQPQAAQPQAAPPQAAQAKAAAEMDALIMKLEKLESEIGSTIGFESTELKREEVERLQAKMLRAKWQQLQSMAPAEPNERRISLAEELVSDIRAMISRAGDLSNLTLDPEMDSYYLADVSSVVTAQALGRIRAASLSMLPLLDPQGRLSEAGRSKAAVYAAAIRESDFDRMVGDLDTAIRENAKAARGPSITLKPGLAIARAAYETAGQELLDRLKLLAEGKAVPASLLQKSFADASGSTLELSAKVVEELDHVLQARIDAFAAYRLQLIGGTLAALLLSFALFVVVVQSITRPLLQAIHRMEQVSAGDLTVEIPAGDLERADEIGQLSRSMQFMLSRMREMLGDLQAGMQTLSLASTGVQRAACRMKEGSQSTSDKVQTVAAAAEQMSANVGLVARGMESTAQNLDQVAGATEQMTTTIAEIARNSEQARRVTAEASRQANHVTTKINELGSAAREIGKVTEAITAISSQTNLLALNATIEAARAGAAGKGFAVVANEIKALAQQTATATEDIRLRIASVQASTQEGIEDVARVSEVIAEVRQIVHSIAAAIEEQSVSTKDIASNVGQASIGVQEASARLGESSIATNDIAREMVLLNQSAGGMAANGEHLGLSATELSEVSRQLAAAAAQFHT